MLFLPVDIEMLLKCCSTLSFHYHFSLLSVQKYGLSLLKMAHIYNIILQKSFCFKNDSTNVLIGKITYIVSCFFKDFSCPLVWSACNILKIQIIALKYSSKDKDYFGVKM